MNNNTTGTDKFYFYGLLVPPNVSVLRYDNDIVVSWNEIYEPNVSFEIWDIINDNYPVLLGVTVAGANSFTATVNNTIDHKIIVRAKQNNIYSGFCNPVNLPVSTYYFSIPTNELTVLVGNELIFQGNELVNFPIGYGCKVIFNCDIGSQVGNNFVVNAAAIDIGNHVLTIRIEVDNFITEIKTINLIVKPVVGVSAATVMLIGDSTMLNTASNLIGDQLNNILLNSALNFVGTQGTTIKHEAHGGYTWLAFSNVLPFYIAGAFNLPQYFINNGIAIPDIVYIRLGVNDISGYLVAGVTDANINTIINNANFIINAFLALSPTLRVIVGYPTLTGINSIAWDADYNENVFKQNSFINAIHRLQLAYKKTYSNNAYDVRVSCSFESINVNRDTDFLNGVHPNNSGYINIGKGLAPYINNLL